MQPHLATTTKKNPRAPMPADFKFKIRKLMLTHSIPEMEKMFSDVPSVRTHVNECVNSIIEEQKENKILAEKYAKSGKLHTYHAELKKYLETEEDKNRKVLIELELQRLTALLFH